MRSLQHALYLYLFIFQCLYCLLFSLLFCVYFCLCDRVDDMHYRKVQLCRGSTGLPSAIFRALGKHIICRVSLSAKKNTWHKIFCRESDTRQTDTLGKWPVSSERELTPLALPSVWCLTLGKGCICRVSADRHSANRIFFLYSVQFFFPIVILHSPQLHM
jgi:hypothetical protein